MMGFNREDAKTRSGLTNHQDMSPQLDALSKQIVDSLFTVHKELGPGLLEKIYEEALVSEFTERNIPFVRQQPIPVIFKGKRLPIDYKLDICVAGSVILELKTVEAILPVHKAQLLSYMKLMQAPMGFIVNFNEIMIKDGIKRMVLGENLRAFASSR